MIKVIKFLLNLVITQSQCYITWNIPQNALTNE